MTKNQALINIEYEVYKPWVHAGALASGCAAFAAVPLAGPVVSWAYIGAGFSFFWYWGSNNLTWRPKRTKPKRGGAGAGYLVVNSATGSRKIKRDGFEYAPYQAGHIVRETWPETLRRWVRGRTESRPVIDKPHIPREFVFQSHYDGQPVELREDDVRWFLRTAWKERHRGRGLSHRRWVREWRLRPQRYKDLGPHWYRALLVLLREAQQMRKCQLVVCTGPQWYALARDPHITLGILREAETLKGNSQPTSPQSDVFIGTEGVNSFR